MRPVTIVIPVYGDWPSLKDCIASLKKYVSADNKIMLVNDCGPEADSIETNIKKSIKGYENFEYFRNPENLGFLRNCNRAVFELDSTGNDVMLLNSDTIVTAGFIDEMSKVLNSSDDIATVSPRSNNATITTIPIRAMRDKTYTPEDSYEIFLRLRDRLPQYNISPVSHGFCMLIKRKVIDQIGLFDEIFGKGYGEEVDFCLRAAANGYRSAICNRAFVYHMEARSFTLERKRKLIEVNEKVVDQRYPNFRKLARDYRLRIENQESLLLDSFLSRSLKSLVDRTTNLIKKNSKLRSLVSKLKSWLR